EARGCPRTEPVREPESLALRFQVDGSSARLAAQKPPRPAPSSFRRLSERAHGLVIARAARGARARLQPGTVYPGDRRSSCPETRFPRRERSVRPGSRGSLRAALVVAGAALPAPLGGAPFVTYVRSDRAFGLSAPATLIRIPWTPRLANRAWLVDLRMRVPALVKPERALWIERAFWGARHVVSLGYNQVQGRALFPLYFAQRDRVVPLGEAPAELLINFADADHLKLEQVVPESSSRRLSESLESTEVVSTYLDKSRGVAPQQLTVHFGYFSRLQGLTVVLIPLLFFVLGNLAGPLLQRLAARLHRTLTARVQLGRPQTAPRGRQAGPVVPRDTLARLVPGETTYDEVIRLCGPDAEHHEQLGAPGHRTLVYRGRRLV